MNEELHKQIARLNGYLSSDPNNLRLLGDLIDLQFQTGDLETARTLIERASTVNSQDARTRFQKATLHIAKSEFNFAESLLEKLIADGFSNLGVRYNLGLCLSQRGSFSSVEDVLSKSNENENRIYLPERILYARALHHNGKLTQALECLKALESDFDSSAELASVLSVLYLDAEDRVKAKEYAERAEKLESNAIEHQCTLATLALERFDLDDAKTRYNRILSQQNADGRSWLGLGLVCMLEKDLETAESHLYQAINFMPQHLGSWNTLTWVQLVLGKIDDAYATANTALDKDPTFSESHGTLAIILIAKGDRDAAQEHSKKAIRLDKHSFSGRFSQTLLLDQEADQEKIARRLKVMLDTPMLNDLSLGETLKHYATKFKDQG